MAYRFIVLELAYKVVLRSGDKSFDEFDWETKFSEESLTIAIAIGRSLRYQANYSISWEADETNKADTMKVIQFFVHFLIWNT